MGNINQETQQVKQFISSGYQQIDQTFGGWREHGVSIVTYRPGMGSSTFLMNSAVEKAVKGSKVLVISQKMTSKDFFMRVLSKLAGVRVTKLRNPMLLETDEADKINRLESQPSALTHINNNFRFVEMSSDEGLFDMMITHRDEHGIDTVFLDFGTFDKNLLNELIAFSAKEKISIIGNLQMHREIEHRKNKRIVFSDLKTLQPLSEQIDFYGLYRCEVYDPKTTESNQLEIFSLPDIEGKSIKLPIDFSIQTVYQ